MKLQTMTPKDSDTSLKMEAVQIDLLRQAGSAKRLQIMFFLTQQALELSRQAIAKANPNASEFEKKLKFVEVHYGSELARKVREQVSKG